MHYVMQVVNLTVKGTCILCFASKRVLKMAKKTTEKKNKLKVEEIYSHALMDSWLCTLHILIHKCMKMHAILGGFS